MRDRRNVVVSFLALFTVPSHSASKNGQPSPTLDKRLSLLISRARRIAKRIGGRIWPGFDTASFGMILVQEDQELLICDTRIPDGFRLIGRDKTLDCRISTGPRTWRSPNLLAAMPVLGPPSVIVMGTPERTQKTAAEWTLTILHEHFHQWQTELPEYWNRVNQLDLADGDSSGMWMLNFPFPYTDPKIATAYRKATNALLLALSAPKRLFVAALSSYLVERRALAETAGERNWRYFEFQLWQEGAARWTEWKLGASTVSPELNRVAAQMEMRMRDDLANRSIAELGRIAVYSFGAAECMLLDRANPNWRNQYKASLALGPCFA